MQDSSIKGRLLGKTCIITGSSSGLGRAIAFAFAAEGANLFLVDLYNLPRHAVNAATGKADSIHNRIADSPVTLETLVATHGNSRVDGQDGVRFAFHTADMTKAHEVEGLVAQCVQTFGRVDCLVNSAGISVESQHERVLKCHETAEDDWDKTFAVNIKGVFLGCKYVLKQMLEGQRARDWDGKGEDQRDKWDLGWIINIASIQGHVAYLGTPSYCASKGAVVMLTKQIALDYAPVRIHCNAICPGFLRTAMTQNVQGDPQTLKKITDAHPFGGMGDAEDIARTAVFLASRDAAWVTGHSLVVDGGFTIQ